MHYTNRRGKQVQIAITEHAKRRFHQRWRRMYPDKPLAIEDVAAEIEKWFGHCQRVEKLSYREKVRQDRHGGDTIYFRTNAFTFIVQNGALLTVEVSDSELRHLNKSKFVARFFGAKI